LENGQNTFKTDLHERKKCPKLKLISFFWYNNQMEVIKNSFTKIFEVSNQTKLNSQQDNAISQKIKHV
jgi:hypothetical protein